MTESVQYLVLESVYSTIKGLAFDGMDSSRIHMDAIGGQQGRKLPFITCWLSEPESFPIGDDDGGNIADRVDYKVMVAIVAGKDHESVMLPKILKYREQIRRAFLRKRLAGVAEIQRVEVEPQAVFDNLAYEKLNLLVSGLRIVAISQEAR